jgi:hypothetical protein
LWQFEDPTSRVRVRVDEAGGDYQAGGIDSSGRCRVVKAPHACNGAAANPDVRPEIRVTRPVDDHPSVYHHIVRFCLITRGELRLVTGRTQ